MGAQTLSLIDLVVMDTEELETLEYKTSLAESQDAIKSLAAFATARGGQVIFGVRPNGEKVGVNIGQNSLEQFASQIRQNTRPALFPSITEFEEGGKKLLRVEVGESPVKPVWAYHVPLKRVGRTNQKLEPEEVQRLMDSTRGRTWDALPLERWRWEDFDLQRFKRYLELCGQSIAKDWKGQLETLGLISEGKATHALAMLFAREGQQYVASSWVQMGRFEHNSTTKFLDKSSNQGDVLEQIESAIAFVERNTHQEVQITGAPKNQKTPEYPDVAIREAVVNAICHRDYTSTATTQIRIHEDRLEVWNPGELPPGLTIQDLYREHSSLPRNRLLKETLARAGIGERWGTGTTRIVEACAAVGMVTPHYSQEQGVFKVRLAGLQQRLYEAISGLPERMRQAVAYVLQHQAINTGTYARLTEVSERTARGELAYLTESEIFRRAGSGPATHYELHPNLQVGM